MQPLPLTIAFSQSSTHRFHLYHISTAMHSKAVFTDVVSL